VAALAPKIEALEASWNRLRAISGGETPEQVVRYWDGLKSKEQSMMGLVHLAERREATCKQEMAALMQRRSEMLETRAAAQAAAAAAADAAAAAAAAAEHAKRAEAAAAGGDEEGQAEEEEETPLAKIATAEKRIAAAEAAFLKLRRVCISADQGLVTLLHKARVSLGETPLPQHLSVAPTAAPAPAAAAAASGKAGSLELPSAGSETALHAGSVRTGSAASGGCSSARGNALGSAVGAGSRTGRSPAGPSLASKSAM